MKVFNDKFQHILRSITLENKFACVIGDYNVNTYGNNEHNNIHTAEFSNQFMLNGFTKLIIKPTRIFQHKKSLLDNIYTTLPIHIDTCQHGIILSDFSDHFTIYAIFSKAISTTQNNYRYHRSFCDKNIYYFIEKSKELSWFDVFASNSLQSNAIPFFIICLILLSRKNK